MYTRLVGKPQERSSLIMEYFGDLRNDHVKRLGDPASRNGAVYFVKDQEGLVQMATDIKLHQQYVHGLPITATNVSLIEAKIRTEQSIYNRIISDAGIPTHFRSLFDFTKKSEVDKFCREITISEFDLFLLIKNCSQINFLHQSKFPEFIPDFLTITDDDRTNMDSGIALQFSRKIFSILIQRRHIHVHLFQRGSEWHCFYFSYKDVLPQKENHWKSGPHIHYVSYLWPNHTKELIWSSFDKRRTKISGDLHIRLLPVDFSGKKGYQGAESSAQRRERVSFFPLASDLTSGHGTEATPMAEIATRGCFIAKISIPVP